MKPALTLLAVLVLLALTLLGLWKLLPTDEPASPADLDRGSAAEVGEQPAAPTGEVAGEGEDGAREALAGAEERPEPREESWSAADSLWLRGTVSARGPCGGSEELVAYAFEEPVDLRTLDRVLAGELEGGEPASAAGSLLSRRPVGPDLAFELPLPPDSEGAHVIVLGRFLYMPTSEQVELASGEQLVLRPRCGAAIDGRVELPPGTMLKEGEVELELSGRLEGQVSREMGYGRVAAAGADGRFTLRGVRTGRALLLGADCEQLAPARVELEPLAPGETGRVRLVLTHGATVRGRVVDRAGQGVAEAQIEGALKTLMAPDLGAREATSDGEGRFTLAALPAGTVTIQAKHAGYRDSESVRVDLAEGQELTGVELALDEGATLAGRVHWNGLPAAGVLVRARLDPAQRFRMGGIGMSRGTDGEDETDEQGRFRITGLGEGRFDLRVRAEPPEELREELAGSAGLDVDDPVLEEDWLAYAPSIATGAQDLALALEPPRGVSGRVLDETGAPVTSFSIRAVHLVKTQLGDFARSQRDESFEDEEGRFRLSGLVEGSWNLFAMAEGFSPSTATPLAMPAAETEPLELRVMRSATVSGTVYTPRGTPIGGATVSVDTGGPFWTNEISGAPTPPSVTTAEDGTYTLSDLQPGSLTLIASAEEHARATSEPLELAPGQHVAGVDLSLREGGTVTGVVYGSDSERSARRMVQAVRMSDMTIHFARTDARGEFRLEHLDPGDWQVQALPDEQVLASLQESESTDLGDLISEIRTAVATVEEGGTTHVELGRPPANPIELRGSVVANGEPLGRAIVSFYSEGKDMLQKLRNATTDDQGEFTLTLDGPGKYVAAVQRLGGDFTQQSSVEFQVEIPEVEEHDLDLVLPLGRISGFLRGPGGRPVADERVTLYPAGPTLSGTLWGGGYSEVRSQEDGSFDLRGLRPGTWAVAVGGMQFGGMFDRSARFGREVREVEVREDEWVQGVDFELEPAAVARIRVVDGAGKPVPGAAVFVRDEAGHLVELFSATATDAQGTCEYGGLMAGRYSFCARKDGFASEETRAIQVGGAEVTEVALMLEEGTILWVKLLDGEGNGVQATISVLDEDGRQVGTMVALADVFELLGGEGFSMTERRIGPLPPGSYQVIATTAGGKVEKKPVHLRKRAERRLSIIFRD